MRVSAGRQPQGEEAAAHNKEVTAAQRSDHVMSCCRRTPSILLHCCRQLHMSVLPRRPPRLALPLCQQRRENQASTIIASCFIVQWCVPSPHCCIQSWLLSFFFFFFLFFAVSATRLRHTPSLFFFCFFFFCFWLLAAACRANAQRGGGSLNV